MRLPPFAIRVVTALGLASALACGEEAPPPEIIRPVIAMQVAHEGAFDERWFPGRAKATREANIAFEVPGRLVERPVQIGDTVKKGQLLAKLDPRDFLNSLNQARASRTRAEAFRDRVVQAARSGAVSRQEVTDAEAELEANDAEVEIRSKALQDSELFAPFDGRISAILVENFENVLGKQVIMRVLDTSKIEMVINIPERLISNAPYVTGFRVRFAPFPGREFPGTLVEISNEATEATRTYPVNVLIDQPGDVEILPGMAGEALAVLKLPKDTGDPKGLEVKMSALVSDEQGGSYVWVIDPETKLVSRRDVELGETTSRGIFVRGLQRGEWVAVAGTLTLEEGQKVRLVEPGRRG
ncbi:MAG: efflux RND transporter periplasmic adaptor subunit [Myxococcota bacterium]|nr:efflux RND transporter periplasmic adaptor subunit [Myxococcota bacterium]